MKNIKRIGLFFTLFFCFFVLKSKVNASGVPVTSGGNMEVYVQATANFDYAKQVVNLVNQERKNAGLSEVTLDEELTYAAMQRSVECSLNFAHIRPNNTSFHTACSKAKAENIAQGYWTPSYAMEAWMNSSGHKSNILSKGIKSIGVGCSIVNGYYNWVQLFSFYDSDSTNIPTGSETGYIGVEVPMSNFQVTLNSQKDIGLEAGKTVTIKATAEYNGQTFELDNSTLDFSVSDTTLATVDNGAIQALKEGYVILTTKASIYSYTNVITITPRILSVYYRTHVQNVGWQDYVRNGTTSGTSGKSLRLEGINIYLDNIPVEGGIEYCTHVQNIGWQNYVNDGEMSGTSGKSLRLEAIKIRLTGEMSNKYDIYYRVHCQNIGWMGWAKNGESAGSAGFGYRLEAIEIKLVIKDGGAPGSTSNCFKQNIIYQTHVQNIGWQGFVNSGSVAGTSGQSLRLEGIQIRLDNSDLSGNVEYCTHIQNIGWEPDFSKKNGAMSGTSGRSLRLEAIKIRLTGDLANRYDIYYRVHCQNIGWMGWAKNGEKAGSAGYSYRLEAIQIVLVDKNGSAPGNTANAFQEQIPIPVSTPVQTQDTYLINTRSKTFHKTSCGNGQSTSDKYKQYKTEPRESLISQGYKPCGNCKP